MEDNRFAGTFRNRHENGDRKDPYSYKDVTRKLSFINRKIVDLQHQRKIAYKSSSKVKKMVHNQVNQIVKCLRSRERNLWSDVDEAHLLQDENINAELLRLQSVHASCQTLLDNLAGHKGLRVIDKIYSTLSEVNLNEVPNGKSLEFTSEFEAMKTMASSFGKLNGDFVKREEFVLIDKKDDPLNLVSKKSDTEEGLEKVVPLDNFKIEDSKNELKKSTEPEDSFEIVDMPEIMSCDEFVKDSSMAEQEENSENSCQPIENVNLHGNGSKFLKVLNSFESSQSQSKINDFNPEEEWKEVFEMRNRIVSIFGPSEKLDDSFYASFEKSLTDDFNNLTTADKNCESKIACLPPKDAEILPQDNTLRKDITWNKCTWRNTDFVGNENMVGKRKSLEMEDLRMPKNRLNIKLKSEPSPAELIRKAFSPYLAKEGIENWILYK